MWWDCRRNRIVSSRLLYQLSREYSQIEQYYIQYINASNDRDLFLLPSNNPTWSWFESLKIPRVNNSSYFLKYNVINKDFFSN